MHSGADEIVKTLKEAGVDVVFGIPSIHNIRLYEALRKESNTFSAARRRTVP